MPKNLKKISQNTRISELILGAFIFASFFVFSNLADARIASVDTLPTENEAKVCKDITCANPKPGIIYFKISSDSPLVVDTEKGLSGKVWGDELGWITFNPPYGGVFFADPATGLLKGSAWSENSGAINFSVTGQKVVIDPKTGEWNGWAWASGPYGGWVKFDCKDFSCVHTTWKNEVSPSIPSTNSSISSKFNLGEIYNSVVLCSKNLRNSFFKEIAKIQTKASSFLTDIFTKNSMVNKNEFPISPPAYKLSDAESKKGDPVFIKTKFSEVYDSIHSNFNKIKANAEVIDTASLNVKKVSPSTLPIQNIQDEKKPSSSPSLGENIKNTISEKNKILNDNLNIFVSSSKELLDKTEKVISDTYNTIYSGSINLRNSVLP